MKTTYLGVIGRPGSSNTRCLVICGGKFHSVKLPNIEVSGKNSGDVLEFDEKKLDDMAFDERWLRRFFDSSKSQDSVNSDLRDKILKHLAEYKLSTLKIQENGYWELNGQKKEHPHILRKEDILRNLIDRGYFADLRREYMKIDENDIHKGFANLNSSQAFALNFFVPLISEQKFDALKVGLEKADSCAFEKILEKDENTQLDFYATEGGKAYSFEVKYSEDSFGGTKNDERHREKWAKIYEKDLGGIVGMEEFFEEYQLWRNIRFALKSEGHTTCFVLPKFRGDLKETVENAVETLRGKKNPAAGRVKIVIVDDAVDALKTSESDALRAHFSEFGEKYLKGI